MWEEIWEGIRAEFSDLPSIESATRLIIRLMLGAVLGGLIGFEREFKPLHPSL